MKQQKKILFFADRLPPLIGGVEVHGGEFINYFKNHPLYPIIHTVVEEKEPIPFDLEPQILFFNSGRWIERLIELRQSFPKKLFVYRTGGNEILKAPLVYQKEPSYERRLNYWVRTLNKTIDILITNSSFTEKRLREIGIKVPFYRCVGGAYASRPPEMPKSNPVLFSATRFVEYKNPFLLIEVFQRLQKKKTMLELRIAGDGPLFPNAKKLSADIPNLTLLGTIQNDQVMTELARSSLYLQFSSDYLAKVPGGSYIHTEGMGRSILEAISSGKYVIAGNCGALSEILSPNRGKLISLDSKEHIEEEILSTLNSLPQTLPTTDEYSWTRIFQRYEALYESSFSH